MLQVPNIPDMSVPDGIAVLRKTANGQGFDSSAPLGALTAADFPGTDYSFKKLTRLSNADSKLDHVRKITCLNQVLYILTEDNLYAVDFAANKFQNDPGPAALGEVAIDLMGVPNNAGLLDFIVLAGKHGANNFKALLATPSYPPINNQPSLALADRAKSAVQRGPTSESAPPMNGKIFCVGPVVIKSVSETKRVLILPV